MSEPHIFSDLLHIFTNEHMDGTEREMCAFPPC